MLVVESRGGYLHLVGLCLRLWDCLLDQLLLWGGADEVCGHVVVGLLRPCASHLGVSHTEDPSGVVAMWSDVGLGRGWG